MSTELQVSDNDEGDVVAGLVALATALPAPVAHTAGAALSRLVGGLTSYPVAWLRRATQAVEDGTNARTIVSNAVALAAAKSAVADPVVVEQALGSLLSKHVREQRNKAAVAKEALEALSEGASEDDSPSLPVDDDWMNVFERYAETASSDRMRVLWGRVLAGEIRSSGAYSLSTMRFLSEADQETVMLAQEVSQYIVAGYIFKTEDMNGHPLFSRLLAAQECGLISGVGVAPLSMTLTVGPAGYEALNGRQWSLRIEAAAGWSCDVPIINVSRIGREISSLSPSKIERDLFAALVERMDKSGVSAIHLGEVTAPGKMRYPTQIWPILPP